MPVADQDDAPRRRILTTFVTVIADGLQQRSEALFRDCEATQGDFDLVLLAPALAMAVHQPEPRCVGVWGRSAWEAAPPKRPPQMHHWVAPMAITN